MKTNFKKKITLSHIFLGLVLWFGQGPLNAQQNIVQNGGFENGWQNDAPTDWGWTYNVGLMEGFPDAAQGSCFAFVYGTIFQDLPTTPGMEYQVQFALAGNYNSSAPNVVDVFWGNEELGTASWIPSGHSIRNMGWEWVDFDVVAVSTNTVLTFEDPFVGDGSGRIPAIDAVSVVGIPDEPWTIWLLGLGLLAIFIWRGYAVKIA
jgi:hypothetical protein